VQKEPIVPKESKRTLKVRIKTQNLTNSFVVAQKKQRIAKTRKRKNCSYRIVIVFDCECNKKICKVEKKKTRVFYFVIYLHIFPS
jgi:hypothetical protein